MIRAWKSECSNSQVAEPGGTAIYVSTGLKPQLATWPPSTARAADVVQAVGFVSPGTDGL
jgi:hypothetical protein